MIKEHTFQHNSMSGIHPDSCLEEVASHPSKKEHSACDCYMCVPTSQMNTEGMEQSVFVIQVKVMM